MSDPLPPPTTPDDLVRRNQKMGLTVLTVVIGMIGLSFASVPLYELFCRVTGFGGEAFVAQQPTGQVLDRKMTVRFNTDTNPNLPWDFQAEQRSVTLPIGQEALISYQATNQSDQPVAGTAIYNVTPVAAGKYFHKTQCFCFNYQMIAPGQEAHFPVVFYIDPAIQEDRQLENLETITLSYTFFRADSPELETALEDFYNSPNSGTKAVPIN
jgi:cytochrome c oxidase assembly protein subunit 11